MREFVINCATADFRLDSHTFDSHIAGALDPLRQEYFDRGSSIPSVDKFIIDASQVREADNYGCLALVLLCEHLKEKFRSQIVLNTPTGGDFFNDFYSGGFYSLIENVVKLEPEMVLPDSPPSGPDRSFYVKKIASSEDINQINMLHDYLVEDNRAKKKNDANSIISKLRDNVYTFMTIGLELTQNILEHSQTHKSARPYGFISIFFSLGYVEIAVMDLGIGIPASLHMKSTPENSIEAIRLACKKNISAKKEQGRGLGLYLTKKIVTEMRGEMKIRSGKANVVFNAANKYFGENEHAKNTSFFSGTQIQLLLPIDSLMRDFRDGIEIYDF
jgi:anti-sigma regulatory factor (Ser/Thr protein kinase)